MTHDLKLRRARLPLERFLEETGGLGNKRGPLLVQLPPSLAFDARVAARFFDLVRSRYDSFVVCEPRHESWFSVQAEALLVRYRVARVAADPAPAAGAELPVAGRGSSTSGCTARRGSTGRDMTTTILRDSPTHCA